MSSPVIVGVLNVTPDSFFDGGKYASVEQAAEAAGQMLADGADIIEIGGESTGPKSEDIAADEEINRTIPVIKKIMLLYPNARVSIDTSKSPVALGALGAGASMVNDVTAGRADPQMFPVIAEAGISVVLMYAKDPTPRTTIEDRRYDDVIATVKKFLAERKQMAMDAGIDPAKIILDPGLGHFVSSDAKYSFEILARLPEFLNLGCPLFVSPSRKSFLAGPEKLPTSERLPGTIAASIIAVVNGAMYIRTHDVKEVKRACEIAKSIMLSH